MDFFKVLFVLVIAFSCAYVYVCPYTKVEESFNTQAMHDVIFHQTDLDQYDHLEFPGVVPRTFLGPVAISSIVLPTQFFWSKLNLNFPKPVLLSTVRCLLATVVCYALFSFVTTVQRKFGVDVAIWLLLITASQFHFLFYSSRPLPNTFALVFALLASAHWLDGESPFSFVSYSGFAIIVFRSELCLLFGPMLLISLYHKQISWTELIVYAAFTAVCSLGLTILVDSFFWQRWLWPEGSVLWYNTILNKSSNWGTVPFLWYFYSVLPRCLLASLVFIPIGLFTSSKTRLLVTPALVFVFMYSFLPHKELRFIIYVVPLLNTAAAVGCSCLTRWRKVFTVFCVLHLIANLAASAVFLTVSINNYPGGQALRGLHQLSKHKAASVYIDEYSAQTGVTRFLESNADWSYSKNESISLSDLSSSSFTYLLIGTPNEDDYSHKTAVLKDAFKVIRKIDCFKRIKPKVKALLDFNLPFSLETSVCVIIMEAKKS